MLDPEAGRWEQEWMYLKSIEVHGFKSFANKILFEFHNGITGIVGPNGSGKSNVADAVRWVLGEQRLKQLRGSNMQDVIFSGTESRNPLSYAYVAITLDNSDRQINLDFNEVTVARRVYRSGESEYLINKTICRLKDINELFYDTGIGKEGYSIIGQGQIDQILSGKPEERRELFDEAAGIVKFKKRKAAACKKLESEQQNLIRVRDIIEELEKQAQPLEKQAEKARIYLRKKEELKDYDVNLFLMEARRIQDEEKGVEEKTGQTERDYQQSGQLFLQVKEKYARLEQDIRQLEDGIEQLREKNQKAQAAEGKLTGEIDILNEQISAKIQRKEELDQRITNTEREKEEKQKASSAYEKEQAEIKEQLFSVKEKKDSRAAQLKALREEINLFTQKIDLGKQEVITLLNKKASTKANRQRYDTMLEQANIRKAQLNRLLIQYRSQETEFLESVKAAKEQYHLAQEELKGLTEEETRLEEKKCFWQKEREELTADLNRTAMSYHKQRSRYDSLRNIAERYDGYGNSIRRIMEQKDREPGLLGVVADLIKVEKQYETAIETALGGSIQNIVTEDEATAKKMIEYLKQNKFGRATFLPLTSMRKNKSAANPNALEEYGVVGTAEMLVRSDEKFKALLSHLLGRTYVVEHIDHAIALARKFNYSLRIVTLDGESLNPGGSMTGGAFKNSSSLLGRKREIEDLKVSVLSVKQEMENKQSRLDELNAAYARLEEEVNRLRSDLARAMVLQNTAGLHEERIKEQRAEKERELAGYQQEMKEIESQILEINENQSIIITEISKSKLRESEIESENHIFQKELEERSLSLAAVQKVLSEIELDEAGNRSKSEFVRQNISRVQQEIKKLEEEIAAFYREKAELKEDVRTRQQQREEIEEKLRCAREGLKEDSLTLKNMQEEREQMALFSRQLLEKREELSEHSNALDKELFRLNNQKERLSLKMEELADYMWAEYELTYHNAQKQNKESITELSAVKNAILSVKSEIKALGDINVNAIEDYKSLMERYVFLKVQYDDLVEAENTLLELIAELDQGMRIQFGEKFADIQTEFDQAFKELFGGGKGTLQLVGEEDVLESGIRIIAQPPGKKLQNMMQLSGGEKALTAIALLFAIQNLKPSPFCLLDEIEAALDDSNVGRFASYLHKLTRHTQYIIITHRRGTMAAADRLYGITMQEKGVSTLVSVNLIESSLDQ